MMRRFGVEGTEQLSSIASQMVLRVFQASLQCTSLESRDPGEIFLGGIRPAPRVFHRGRRLYLDI